MTRKSFLKTLILTILLVAAFAIPASAATVAKVKSKTTYTANSTQYTVIKGVTKSGKKVWSYKTKTSPATELCSASYVTKGKFVYLLDNNYYIRLYKSTGKVAAKRKLPEYFGSAVMAVDAKKNLYCMGFYGNTVYKVGKGGKVLWKKKVSNDYVWPTKIRIKTKKIVVTFDNFGDPKTKSFAR